MRSMKKWLAVLAMTLVAGSAIAGGLTLLPGAHRLEFTNCAAGGSTAQSVYRKEYLLRVKDEGAWLCYAATCASGGEWFPANTLMLVKFPTGTTSQMSVSCRSTGATGDVILTRGEVQ